MRPFDCEALSGAFPQQPVNTWSSLAFVLTGLVLWRRRRHTAAVAVALVGVGSVLFHGAPSTVSSLLHDVGIFLVAAVLVLEVWRRAVAGNLPWTALGLTALGLAVWATSRSGGPLCRPESLFQGHAVWHGFAALALALTFTNRAAADAEA